MNFPNAKPGMKLEYLLNDFSFHGQYTIYTSESTYLDSDSMPESEKGKLFIVELMNNGTPMYFDINTRLNKDAWRLLI